MTRYAVVGSRDFDSQQLVHSVLRDTLRPGDIIVSGGARGVDRWAEEWADSRGFKKDIYRPGERGLPSWKEVGKAAGPIRNAKIIENSDVVLAFWDGESRGTKDTLRKAADAGKITKLFVVKTPEKVENASHPST